MGSRVLNRGLVIIDAKHRSTERTYHVTVEVRILEHGNNGYVRVKVVKVTGCERSMRGFFRAQVSEWMPLEKITEI